MKNIRLAIALCLMIFALCSCSGSSTNYVPDDVSGLDGDSTEAEENLEDGDRIDSDPLDGDQPAEAEDGSDTDSLEDGDGEFGDSTDHEEMEEEESCDGCLVDDLCISAGQNHPELACAHCDPQRNTNGWSPKLLGTKCRAAAGICDATEVCDGQHNDCPVDVKSTAECRPAVGRCDLEDFCDGINDDCPADAKRTEQCRPSFGPCDLVEVCDGVNDNCPADAKSTNSCRPANGICDVAEVCDGISNDCPTDGKSTSVCRAANGVCDVAEVCNGINNDCPADRKSTSQCRPSIGECDIAEVCNGVSNDCPANASQPAGTPCGTSDQCNGFGSCLDCINSSGCGDLPDDGNPCTDAVCYANICTHLYDNDNTCSDGHDCTQTQCQNGQCVPSSTYYGCFINDACISEGAHITSTGNNSCLVCNRNTSWSSWTTLSSGSCDDGNPCTYNDACRSGGTCTGTNYSCNSGTCNGDGTCTCDNDHMNANCSDCAEGYTGYPDCVEEDYCKYNQCWPVPPTNVSGCYDDSRQINCPGEAGSESCGSTPFCGQDAQYPDNMRHFVCSGGTCSASAASEHEVVTDSLTGLMWQRTFFENQSWQEAVDTCDTLNYGGYQDWRLPSQHELRSIVENGEEIDPAINTSSFPGTPSTYFWSSSSYANLGSSSKWVITFLNGMEQSWPISLGFTVRCVRGGLEASVSERYVLSVEEGEEIVSDRVTGLVWQNSYGESKLWLEALSYCENLSYAGETDWRLPNIKELTSIINYDVITPASDFPDLSYSDYYWSSTTSYLEMTAWCVSFYYGLVSNVCYKSQYQYRACCVRGGP